MPKPKSSVPKFSASHSFLAEEVAVLEHTFETLLRGAHPFNITRHKAFNGVVRKIRKMKARLKALEEEHAREMAQGPKS